jgi:hypothetical protein
MMERKRLKQHILERQDIQIILKSKDEKKKKAYLDRHRTNENWNDYMSAGSLSRWTLWNKKTLSASIADYKIKFNLK